jgi:hypothetical protein
MLNKESIKSVKYYYKPGVKEKVCARAKERYALDTLFRLKAKQYSLDYYKNPKVKEAAQKNKKQRRENIKKFLLDLKSREQCSICGEDNPTVLDYHHIDPSNKKFTIGEAVNMGYSKKLILLEISKCILVCGNCHIKENRKKYKEIRARSSCTTYRRRNTIDKYNFIDLIKKESQGCIKCGNRDPEVLEFHHRDRKEKRLEVSLAASNNWSLEKMKCEIRKCDIICRNCHKKEYLGALSIIPPPALDTPPSPAILPLTDPVTVQSIKEDPDHGRIRPEALSIVGPAPQ